jgi:hypothetical protein
MFFTKPSVTPGSYDRLPIGLHNREGYTMECSSDSDLRLAGFASLRHFLFISFTLVISQQPASGFREEWQVLAIRGDTAQIRDYLGKMHYLQAGDELEGVKVVEVDAARGTVRVRDAKSGREKTLTPTKRRKEIIRPTGAPGVFHAFSLGVPIGLETEVHEIWIERVRLGEILFQLSDAAFFSFVTTPEVRGIPVTVRLSNMTVREFLDVVLPAHGCAWKSLAGDGGIRVGSGGAGAGPADRIWGPQAADRNGLDTVIPLLELHDRPIKELLNLLSRFSGLNFLTTAEVPDVPVTCRMTNVTVREVLDMLLPSYNLNWIRKPGEDLVRVMTSQEYSEEFYCTPEFVSYVFILEYADLQKVSSILLRLKSPEGTMFVLPRVRKIIVTDLVANIETMQNTVEELEASVSSAAAATITDGTRQLDERTRPDPPSYYGPTHPQKYCESTKKPEFLTRVIELNHASMEEVAPLIQAWRRPEGTVGQSSLAKGRIILTDTPERLEKIERIIRELDVPATFRRVFRLRYINAEEAAQQLHGVLSPRADSGIDPIINALTIEDLPVNVEEAATVIADLDRERPVEIFETEYSDGEVIEETEEIEGTEDIEADARVPSSSGESLLNPERAAP